MSPSARSPPPSYTSQRARPSTSNPTNSYGRPAGQSGTTEHTPLFRDVEEDSQVPTLARKSRKLCYGVLVCVIIFLLPQLTAAWWLFRRWPACKKDGVDECKAYWGEVEPIFKCIAHGTREYWAQMYDIPDGQNWIKTCETTTAKLHGKDIGVPTRCEQTTLGGVRGYWQIDGDLDCTPYWDSLHDKGCMGGGSGIHRWEARLWNIKHGDDWMTMCSTTPATIQGTEFDHPTYCVDGGISGMWGMWETKDVRCQRL